MLMCRSLRLLSALGFAGMLVCTAEYNPFADSANAGVRIMSADFASGDTVQIFTSYSLSIGVTVGELLDSVTIDAPKNRLWRDTALIPPYSEETIVFTFSFDDTGDADIRIISHRVNATAHSSAFRLHVRSPLRQQAITGYFGKELALETEPVGDLDVLYHWHFGKDVTIVSPLPKTTVVLPEAGADSGELWVADSRLRTRSPACKFAFTLGDTLPPNIICVNAGSVHKDTVITGEDVLAFRVRITDRGDGPVYNATIDEGEFDQQRLRENVYTKIYADMQQFGVGNPRRAIVRALDNLEFRNEAIDTFWLAYDPDARQLRETMVTILIPSESPSRTNASEYDIFGSLDDYVRDSVTLLISANGAQPETLIVEGGRTFWQKSLILDSDTTRISATAFSKQGDSLARATASLVYDPAFKDTTAPILYEITLDGKPAQSYYTSSDTTTVRIVALDDGAGVRDIIVNNQPMQKANATATWSLPVSGLVHQPAGNRLSITCTDAANNTVDTAVTVFRNSPPVLEYASWDMPYLLALGSEYRDTLYARDDDLTPRGEPDRISFQKAYGPDGLSVGSNGVLSWTPTAGSAGEDSAAIVLYDGYQAREFSRRFRVVDLSQKEHAVRFASTESDFPAFLETGADSLHVSLEANPETGKPPYVFSARLAGTDRMLLSASASGALVWKPQAADTGYQKLIVTVTDAYQESDTLYPRIRVVAPNKPCSIALYGNGTVTANGALDMRACMAPETLSIIVADPDLHLFGLAERFAAGVIVQGREYSVAIDSLGRAWFVLDPGGKKPGSDQVKAWVSDRSGHTDTASLAVDFGQPPSHPRIIGPNNDGYVYGGPVTLQWSSDRAGECPIVYDVVFGREPNRKTVAELTADTTVSLGELLVTGTYYWQVFASNGRGVTQGPLWSFEYVVPDGVQFAVSEADFPRALEAGVDTLSMVLQTRSGLGVAPFQFRAAAHPGASLLLEPSPDSVLVWSPRAADIGAKKLMITVTDSSQNADTLHPIIEVVPPNQHSCSLSYQFSGISSNDSLDMREAQSADTLWFSISDQDHALTESYTVSITHDYTTSVDDIGANRDFTLVIVPIAGQSYADSIEVSVQDRTQTADTLMLYIRGGSKSGAITTSAF